MTPSDWNERYQQAQRDLRSSDKVQATKLEREHRARQMQLDFLLSVPQRIEEQVISRFLRSVDNRKGRALAKFTEQIRSKKFFSREIIIPRHYTWSVPIDDYGEVVAAAQFSSIGSHTPEATLTCTSHGNWIISIYQDRGEVGGGATVCGRSGEHGTHQPTGKLFSMYQDHHTTVSSIWSNSTDLRRPYERLIEVAQDAVIVYLARHSIPPT